MLKFKLQKRTFIEPGILILFVIITSIPPYIFHVDNLLKYYPVAGLLILPMIICNICFSYKAGVSDLYIDTNSITIIYKQFSKITNKICIDKKDITSFHIDVNIFLVMMQKSFYHNYEIKILITTNNPEYRIIPLTIRNNGAIFHPKMLIMDFLKYKNYIPNFSCKITGDDYLLIEEIKQYYQTSKKAIWFKRKGEFIPYKIICKKNSFEC